MFIGTQPTVLTRAPLRPYGTFATFRYSPDGDDKDTGDPVKDAAHKAAPVVPAEPEKLTLTKAELDAQIQAALAGERQKAEAKAKKDQEAADRKKAEEEGKFKELADAADKRAAEAEARALSAERSALVNDAFADVLKDNDGLSLSALNEWVRPKVLSSLAADTSPEDVTKQAKALAEKFAKDNPVKPKGSAGAPGNIPGRQPVRGGTQQLPQNNERTARRFSSLTRRV